LPLAPGLRRICFLFKRAAACYKPVNVSCLPEGRRSP
jgi:hypothetical protein